MLLGWKSQKTLGLLHSNWPGVIQEEASAERVNQVTEKEEGPRGASLNKDSQKKMKNRKKQQDFPMDGKQHPEILSLLHEYSDIFRNKLEDTDRLSGGVLDLQLKPGAQAYMTNRVQC